MTPLILAAIVLLQPAPERRDEVSPRIRAYGGDWYCPGFAFDGTRVDGRREVDGRDAGIAGLEIGVELEGSYFSFVGVEQGLSNELSLQTVSIGAGAAFDVGGKDLPRLRVSPWAAVMAGTFEVDLDDFGDFLPGLGVRAGCDVAIPIAGAVELGIFAEARFIRFEYDEDVVDGDEWAGGFGGAGGVSLRLGF